MAVAQAGSGFRRVLGWFTGLSLTHQIVIGVGVAILMVGGLVAVASLAQNPCDRYIADSDAGVLDGIVNLERFEREYTACNEWLIDHPDRLDDYRYLP